VPLLPSATLDQAALRAWGEALGASVALPTLITLRGPLGAGKTTVAQAILAGAGVSDDVTSPTFALVHRYAAQRGPVAHLDLYRLRAPEELFTLGWDDLLREAVLVVVEWPERVEPSMLGPRLEIVLDDVPGDPDRRSVQVSWLR
jgi:tRNA threonylcarbamoyl adenosine modification protein YjeE